MLLTNYFDLALALTAIIMILKLDVFIMSKFVANNFYNSAEIYIYPDGFKMASKTS